MELAEFYNIAGRKVGGGGRKVGGGPREGNVELKEGLCLLLVRG